MSTPTWTWRTTTASPELVAIARPDLPRLRRSVAAVVAREPELPMAWLFVSDTGHVMVVPPPQQDAEATGPTGEDQSSTRSDLTA